MLCVSVSETPLCVEAPSELRIPEVCCVGLSTQAVLPLHNPSARWLHVDLEVVKIQVGNVKHDPTSIIPFVLKEKVIVEPHTTESIKVLSLTDISVVMIC